MFGDFWYFFFFSQSTYTRACRNTRYIQFYEHTHCNALSLTMSHRPHNLYQHNKRWFVELYFCFFKFNPQLTLIIDYNWKWMDDYDEHVWYKHNCSQIKHQIIPIQWKITFIFRSSYFFVFYFIFLFYFHSIIKFEIL